MLSAMLFDRNISVKTKTVFKSGAAPSVSSNGNDNDYYNRLVKMIPAEVIAFYLALDGIVANMNNSATLLWVVFGIAVAGTWLYIYKANNVTKFVQQILTVFSFVLWVFVIGGPFKNLTWYDENYGKLLVTIYTFFIPLVYKPE
jgi:hypothetical protein